jgi:hypothetical protein
LHIEVYIFGGSEHHDWHYLKQFVAGLRKILNYAQKLYLSALPVWQFLPEALFCFMAMLAHSIAHQIIFNGSPIIDVRTVL